MDYITNTDTSILPYNDDDMRYNLTTRQYVLTVNGLERLTGIDTAEYFDSPTEQEAFLNEISDDVYEFIYDNSLYYAIKFKRWIIAKDSAIREDFKKSLVNHARASLRSGMNLLKDQHGINIEKGKALDLKELRGRRGISYQTEKTLKRIGLLYQGFMYYTDYVEDGLY